MAKIATENKQAREFGRDVQLSRIKCECGFVGLWHNCPPAELRRLAQRHALNEHGEDVTFEVRS